MPNSQKVLDLDLAEFSSAFDGHGVAENIEIRLEALHGFLTDSEIEFLQQTVLKIRKHASGRPVSKKHTHPLTPYVPTAPLYCAMSIDPREELLPSSANLIAVGQSLALLEALRPRQGEAERRLLAKFLHQIARSDLVASQMRDFTPSSLEAEELERCLTLLEASDSETIDKNRRQEYRRILRVLIHHITGEKPLSFEPRKPKLSKLPLNRTKPGGAETTKDGGRPPRRWHPKPDPTPDDTHDDLEPELFETDDETTPQPSEAVARTFNRHGHDLRSYRLYAFMNPEALSELESFLSMKTLIELPTDTPAMAAARLLEILTGQFGYEFDEIGRQTMAPEMFADENNDGQILAITRENNTFTITVAHILGSRIPSVDSKYLTEECSTTFELSITLPELPDTELAWQYLTDHPDPLPIRIDQILSCKRDIKKELHDKGIARFTETRLRGGLTQAVFKADVDLPKVQLMFSERMDASLAALHYLSFDQAELQASLNRANSSLYRNLIPAQPTGVHKKIGAAKSLISKRTLEKSISWYNTTQNRLKKLSSKRWMLRHQLMVDSTMHILGVGTAHRFTQDLANLTINDILFNLNLLIYRDKPAESSMYRRLAVAPSSVMRGLQHFLTYLQKLVEEPGVPTEVSEYAKGALSGVKPLFQLFDEQRNLIAPEPRQLFKELLEALNIDPNLCRHFQSTDLRELSAPPLLVELHLGHLVRDLLIGREGLLSPQDLCLIKPQLDSWFESLGYKVPSFKKDAYQRPLYSGSNLRELDQNERKLDKEKLKTQISAAIEETPNPTQWGYVDQAINSVIKGYDGNRLPTGTTITNDDAYAMRAHLVYLLSGNFLAIYRGCRKLRQRLRILAKLSENCSVSIPPPISWDIKPPIPITPAHMVAADQKACFEKCLLRYAENPNCDRALGARAALVLWGHCPTLKEATIWLAKFKQLPLLKGEGFQIIELSNGESRTISGLALTYCLAWLKNGAPPTKAVLPDIFGKGTDQATVEVTVQYSNWIHYPGVIARVINSEIPQKELSRDRLLDLIFNRRNLKQPKGKIDSKEKKEVPSRWREKPEILEKRFRELRGLIPDSGPAPIKALQNWRERKEIPSVLILLAHWAEILLGPHANLKTSARLRRKTVRSYLHLAWTALSTVFPGGQYEDLDADELSDLLISAISDNDEGINLDDDEGRNTQAKALNRFFREIGNEFDVPQVILPAGHSKQSAIDAGVVTPTEKTLIRRTISSWASQDNCDAAYSAALLQLGEAFDIYAQHGPRTRELSLSRNRDFVRTEHGTAFLVQWHEDRSIKTLAGVRNYELKPEITFSGQDKRTKHHFDFLSHPSLNNKVKAQFDALIRDCTNDPSARTYRFRHTVATVNCSNALMLKDPTTRFLKTTRASAELGHAHFSTTVTHYLHTLYFALAMADETSQPKLSDLALQNLFNIKAPNTRKKKAIARKANSPVSTKFMTGLKTESPMQPRESSLLRAIPEDFKAADGTSINLKTTVLWILNMARNEDPFASAIGLGLSRKGITALATALIAVQRKIGWDAIAGSRLQALLNEMGSAKPPFIETTVHHRRFPGPTIDQLLESMDDEPLCLTPGLAEKLANIDIKKLTIRLTPKQAEKISETFNRHRLPINVNRLKEHAGSYQLALSTGLPAMKHDPNIVRLLLAGLLVNSQICDQVGTNSPP